MLQSMRQLAHSWVVKGLMLFLIVSFSIWGIGDIFRGNPLQKTVAKAGNTVISVQQLNHLFEETLAHARQGVDPSLTAAQAKQMGLLDKTLDNEVKRALVDQDIARLGIDVSPESVLKLISDQPQFRNKDGSFNKEMFRQMMQQEHMTEAGLVAESRQDISRQIMLTALSGSHIVPQTATDAVYKARAQKRVFDVVTIDASQIGGIGAADDKALHDFYDKNPQLFTAPEYRGVTVASLTTDAIAKDIAVPDDQLRKEYDSRLDQLVQPERRDVVQVVVQEEEKAKQLSRQARASGDLAAAAKEAGETAIPLDGLAEKNLLPELAKTVFALHQGDIGGPVKTQLGWHVVQVKKILPAGTPTFDAIKDKLRDDMRRDQAVEAATRAVNNLDDQLAAGHSLDDIADELKLRLVKIPAVDANGLAPDGKEPAELPNKAQTLKDAFAQNTGETSPVEDDKAGNYYVMRTDEITPSGVRPFDQVKDAVALEWKKRQQMAKAQDEADKIAKALSAGKPASSFAGEEGVSMRISDPLSQLGDTDPLLPPDIVAQAFKIEKGQTATATSGSKLIVARLAAIIDADAAQKDPRKGMIALAIKKDAGDELLDQYLRHLYDIFPVKTDAVLLDRLRQQGD